MKQMIFCAEMQEYHVISSSSIQTILSASELHRINLITRVAGCTAGRELHPAPKIIFIHYIPGAAICKYLVKNIEKNVKIGYYIYSVFYGGVNRNETTKEKQQKS